MEKQIKITLENLEKTEMEKQIKITLETLVTKSRNLEENGIYSQRAGVFEKKCRLICEEQNFIWSYFRWNRRNRHVLCAYQTEWDEIDLSTQGNSNVIKLPTIVLRGDWQKIESTNR